MAPVNRRILIQGGMGIAVSSWQLARAVSLQGQLGVVSGTALDGVLARRLQDGDPDGHVRRELNRYFRAGGRPEGDGARALLRAFPDGWTAADSVAGLLSARAVPAAG